VVQFSQRQEGTFHLLDIFKHKQIDSAVSASELGPTVAVDLAGRGSAVRGEGSGLKMGNGRFWMPSRPLDRQACEQSRLSYA
jgi:hypothetical protein